MCESEKRKTSDSSSTLCKMFVLQRHKQQKLTNHRSCCFHHGGVCQLQRSFWASACTKLGHKWSLEAVFCSCCLNMTFRFNSRSTAAAAPSLSQTSCLVMLPQKHWTFLLDMIQENHFWSCLNRKSYLLQCDSSLLYSSELQINIFQVQHTHKHDEKLCSRNEESNRLRPSSFRLQLYVTHLTIPPKLSDKAVHEEKNLSDTSQERKRSRVQKLLWLLRSTREQQVQATEDLHTPSHKHTTLHTSCCTHTSSSRLDVSVTWCNSRPGQLPRVLVSRLNRLPQPASKTPRVKRIKSDEEEEEAWKEQREQREKRGWNSHHGAGLSGVRGTLICSNEDQLWWLICFMSCNSKAAQRNPEAVCSLCEHLSVFK